MTAIMYEKLVPVGQRVSEGAGEGGGREDLHDGDTDEVISTFQSTELVQHALVVARAAAEPNRVISPGRLVGFVAFPD